MDTKKVAEIIESCLGQRINFDPTVDDTGREWWYISPMYSENQKIPYSSVSQLESDIKELDLKSIKEIATFKIFDRQVIQVKGNRQDIINECKSIQNE